MPITLGVVCNFYRESAALPTFFKAAEAVFDELVFVHSPPDGAPLDDSVQLVKDSGHRMILDTITEGFGALRTRCLGYSGCDWVMVLDADERIMGQDAPLLTPYGTDVWPKAMNPANTAKEVGRYNHSALLRELVERADAEGALAICLSRRHFMGAPGDYSQPCQSWALESDWQLRCLKNTPYLCYDPEVKMHERLVDTRTWADPKFLRGDLVKGPFIDHFSQYFKALEPDQNKEDAETYESLKEGCVKEMWLSHQPGLK